MFIQQISHNRRRQVALGTVSLALAGISALTVINSRDTASLASPATAHRVAVGQSAVPQPVVAEQVAAATLASASRWTTGTVRWLAQQRFGLGFVGSAVQASFAPSSASADQATAGSPTVQCSMSSHTATGNGWIVSLCLNPNVTVPSLSGTVQRVRSISHVGVTLPYYSPGRAPSATAPSVKVGTLPSAQTGHNEVTVNLGSRPSLTPGSVDAGTVGQVNAPHITIN